MRILSPRALSERGDLNYIALLGWSPAGRREIYSLDELAEVFDLSGISKSSAIFDVDKLTWMNGEYIRALSVEQFLERAKPYLDTALKVELDREKNCEAHHAPAGDAHADRGKGLLLQ